MWTYKTIFNSSSKRAGYDDDDDDRKQKVRKRLFKLTGSGFCIFMLLSSVIAFSPHSLFFPTIAQVAAVESPCTSSLAIKSLAASGDDGNVPSNTIDGNLSTRWSDQGIGSWIRGDLGEQNATSHHNNMLCRYCMV